MKDDLKNLIELYFDGELDKGMEAVLFTKLSESEDARNYFKQLNFLKASLSQNMIEFPVELEQKIFSRISKKKIEYVESPIKNIQNYFAYAVTVILLIMSLFMFYEAREYRAQLTDTTRQLSEQQKTINLLINSLPSVQVESKLNNTVFVKADM